MKFHIINGNVEEYSQAEGGSLQIEGDRYTLFIWQDKVKITEGSDQRVIFDGSFKEMGDVFMAIADLKRYIEKNKHDQPIFGGLKFTGPI